MNSQLIYNTIRCAKDILCDVEITRTDGWILSGYVTNDHVFEQVTVMDNNYPASREQFPKLKYSDIQSIRLLRE